MQFSSSVLQFGLLLASTVAGQLGGGPNGGTGSWNVKWPDTVIKQPTELKATPLGNNAYTVTFKRDTRDNKYQLSYWINYGSGERYARRLVVYSDMTSTPTHKPNKREKDLANANHLFCSNLTAAEKKRQRRLNWLTLVPKTPRGSRLILHACQTPSRSGSRLRLMESPSTSPPKTDARRDGSPPFPYPDR